MRHLGKTVVARS